MIECISKSIYQITNDTGIFILNLFDLIGFQKIQYYEEYHECQSRKGYNIRYANPDDEYPRNGGP